MKGPEMTNKNKNPFNFKSGKKHHFEKLSMNPLSHLGQYAFQKEIDKINALLKSVVNKVMDEV